ncbi:sacsin N-terminal ATP-binding-like domain-containing protein [Nocardia neocaledoniensis]|uniref:sacsin N-terminal ATP-binding-like domain-containing protein n=1 Tax=Nocardia neocaledoniensis TaxID=236511 RepID=UPI002453CD04|nr:ATP-binding protein [Nocardia neocaledoniensis]
MLAAWRDSPTRLREDSASEADLVAAGYRDRVLTELAQNAADAAAKAGVAGELSVRLVDGRLHVANTGVPLDVSGVHALTALRASGKSDTELVGRFGVGFTAVRSIGDEIEVRSTTGSIRFSRVATLNALHDTGIEIPDDLATIAPPVLRLAWPVPTTPVAGADTEVVVHLRPDIDGDALLAAMRAEAPELLLELPALHRIRIGADEFTSTVADLADGLTELTVTLPGGEHRRWWQYRTARARWLLPVRHGRPVAAAPDVLRAPTRSDEELSLPAILVADIPMQPDRRRLLPGARLTEIAAGYADFARALPPRDRLVLVPTPGFARSEADALLREAVTTELRTHAWLPTCPVTPVDNSAQVHDAAAAWLTDEPAPQDDPHPAATAPGRPDGAPSSSDGGADHRGTPRVQHGDVSAGEVDQPASAHGQPPAGGVTSAAQGADATSRSTEPAPSATSSETWPGGDFPARPTASDSIPTRASVFPDLTPELAAVLVEFTGPLVIPELSDRAAQEKLSVLDVHRLGPAALADLSSGLEREPTWWRRFYAAVEPFVVDTRTAEEFGALAVPLADGRLVTGPRSVVLDDQLTVAVPVHWARLVHPDATHALLSRLGARSAAAEDLLTDPGLRDLLEHDPADPDTVDAVLRLAPFAPAESLHTWLGLLELPDDTGEPRPADELLLPGAPLAEVLEPDSPFGTVADSVVDEYGAEALRAIGVGWDFGVVTDPDPIGPDHDLDDEPAWWESLSEDPRDLSAVRDLDLVDENRWPTALRHLLAVPRTRALLADRDGYTAWWLHRHAHIDGVALGRLRHPDDDEFAGLLPAITGFDARDLDALRPLLVRPDIMSAELAEELLDALADPAKTPAPEVIARTHARLAAAVATGALDPRELDLPEQVRALDGTVVDAATALVLDQPCFGLVVPADRLVAGDTAHAESLATLLDLPLVSEEITAEVLGTGTRTTWAASPLGVVLRQLWSPADTTGALVLHDTLEIHLRGAVTGTVTVPWWHTDDAVHVQVPRA